MASSATVHPTRIIEALKTHFANSHFPLRYEAEALLENKPEGSFLLRDSAQDEFVFSVSFRRYNRSLHARIEESRHEFSFDCHDPGVHR